MIKKLMTFLDQNSFCYIKNGKTSMMIHRDYKNILLHDNIDKVLKIARKKNENLDFYHGRGKLAVVDIPGHAGKRMVIKHCGRGGPVRFFTKDVFVGRSRPFREFLMSNFARSNEINTTEIIAFYVHRFYGLFYRGDIVSLEISESFNLHTYLSDLGDRAFASKFAEKKLIIEMVARLIGKMHNAGIYHRDLNIKNILIQKTGLQPQNAFVIDLDRACVVENMSFRQRMKNLLRLHRSMVKLGFYGSVITRTDTLRFFRSYTGTDSTDCSMVAPYMMKYRLILRFHKFWWKFRKKHRP